MTLGIKYKYTANNNQSSFNHLSEWLDDVSKLTTDEPIKLIIGNKSDIEIKEVNENDVNVSFFNNYCQNFKQQVGIDIVEVSAKNSYKINYIFEEMTKKLIKRA